MPPLFTTRFSSYAKRFSVILLSATLAVCGFQARTLFHDINQPRHRHSVLRVMLDTQARERHGAMRLRARSNRPDPTVVRALAHPQPWIDAVCRRLISSLSTATLRIQSYALLVRPPPTR